MSVKKLNTGKSKFVVVTSNHKRNLNKLNKNSSDNRQSITIHDLVFEREQSLNDQVFEIASPAIRRSS